MDHEQQEEQVEREFERFWPFDVRRAPKVCCTCRMRFARVGSECDSCRIATPL